MKKTISLCACEQTQQRSTKALEPLWFLTRNCRLVCVHPAPVAAVLRWLLAEASVTTTAVAGVEVFFHGCPCQDWRGQSEKW